MAEVKDKKDISILLEGQLPEFVTYDHPKFKKFVEKYYDFLESHQIYFDGITFDEYKLLPEAVITLADGSKYISYENEDQISIIEMFSFFSQPIFLLLVFFVIKIWF